jgi:hypothetical protein
MRDNCKICGAVIGENNHTGIGGGCMQNVVEPSKKDTFFKFRYLYVYIEQVKIWREAFLKEYENTKFRSDFKKSFYASVKENDKLSKKQLEIIKNQISYNFELYSELDKRSKDVFSSSLKSFSPSNDNEKDFMAEKIQMYKISYLSKRGKIDKDE